LDLRFDFESLPDGAVKTVARSLAIVDLIAERGQVTFQELVDSGLPKSSVHNLMLTLQHFGWVEKSQNDKAYRLGLVAWEVGQKFDGNATLIDATSEEMDRLSAQTEETVQLARLEGLENSYLAIRQAKSPMRLASSVGLRLYSHATGVGKAMLSTLTEKELWERFSSFDFPIYTDRTIRSFELLKSEIDAVKQRGYALDEGEYIEGCRCVAVPLASSIELGFPAGLSITIPNERTSKIWPQDIADELRTSRAVIRENLGLIEETGSSGFGVRSGVK